MTAHKNRIKRELTKEMRQEMTLAESILWNELRRNQIEGFHFRRQQILYGFIADFYCHHAGLIVEADGKYHEDQKRV